VSARAAVPVRVQGIRKQFGSAAALQEVSLDFPAGGFTTLLGPSGCGKTTLLRIIAGFAEPDAGTVLVGGRDVGKEPPWRRRIGFVFQSYALWPHMTVLDNVAYGLRVRKQSRAEIRANVERALDLVQMRHLAERPASKLSGGQQQRVALARALAPEPRILLLDEPLSNLDPTLRERTRRELKSAIERVSITTLLVTHEQEEAFHLGGRVAVLYRGVLQQVGTPEELYERPATRFVATFVGRASVLPGRFAAAGNGAMGTAAVALAGAPGAPVWEGIAAEPLEPGDAAELVVRPESLALVAAGTPGALAGRVVERRYGGSFTAYHVDVPGLDGGREVEVNGGARDAAPGDDVAVAPTPAASGAPAPRIFRAGPRPVEGDGAP